MNLPFCGVRQEFIDRCGNGGGIWRMMRSIRILLKIAVMVVIFSHSSLEAAPILLGEHTDQHIVLDCRAKVSTRLEQPSPNALLDRDARQSTVTPDAQAVTNQSANKAEDNPANGSAKGKEALVFPKDFNSFIDQFPHPYDYILRILLVLIFPSAIGLCIGYFLFRVILSFQ